MKLLIDDRSYKIGVDEISGLKDAMVEVFKPLVEIVQDKVYWNDLKAEFTEYRARDGFMPYSSNLGGLELFAIVPKCEEHEFSFLGFGDCDGLDCDHEQSCGSEDEGHLDAKFRVWLKFEGIENGVMSFYLVLSGGNGDAPYFREKHSATYFEAQFEAKTLAQFKKNAAKEIKKLIKVIE